MGFYSELLFPRLMDWVMAGSGLGKYRQMLLAEVGGEVLEIGFGTGLNLPYYSDQVQRIVTIDPNPGMKALAQKRIQATAIPVESQIRSGENLPLADNRFDCVVSTWTLCSIPNVEQALQEIQRVLKPEGQFFFIEHGLSQDPALQVWQNRLTPLQKVIGDGCHLNRNIRRLVESHLELVCLEEFYADNLPKVSGYMYMGVARKTP
ncbi:SAM-dependent methyltransferase [Leptolyngbya sp. 'hensonii']|uniref:class I SAM-dependent methyltransferase n=1 Tax=Leptolyngbya sp. 'hensonii' TaxID=1922337 RepID=UPI00094FDC07|nr:class I SAM-dependent methyltransferase [Leptolyngbya sp. 'hensonii']OLP18458.1 SAM-dependent methyltransferase [Leptolyngbya sp. 'hensonii']